MVVVAVAVIIIIITVVVVVIFPGPLYRWRHKINAITFLECSVQPWSEILAVSYRHSDPCAVEVKSNRHPLCGGTRGRLYKEDV